MKLLGFISVTVSLLRKEHSNIEHKMRQCGNSNNCLIWIRFVVLIWYDSRDGIDRPLTKWARTYSSTAKIAPHLASHHTGGWSRKPVRQNKCTRVHAWVRSLELWPAGHFQAKCYNLYNPTGINEWRTGKSQQVAEVTVFQLVWCTQLLLQSALSTKTSTRWNSLKLQRMNKGKQNLYNSASWDLSMTHKGASCK